MLYLYFPDDTLYIIVVAYTVVVTVVVKSIGFNYNQKQLYALLGVIVILLITGPLGLLWTTLHPVAAVISLILLPRRLALKGFISFYITTIIYIKYNDLPSYNCLVNVLAMVSAIKCISLISDIQKNHVKFLFDTSHPSNCPLAECKATLIDIFYYMYCYCGMFTGPFFTYLTYYNMIYSVDGVYVKNLTPSSNKTTKIHVRSDTWRMLCMKKFLIGLILTGLYMYLNKFNFLHKLIHPIYGNNGLLIERGLRLFLWKSFYLTFLMYTMKCRYIACWSVMESVYVALGLGAYPTLLLPRITTPPKLSQDNFSLEQLQRSEICYTTIQGSDLYKLEFSMEMLYIINGWNPTVNYFMSYYVGDMFVGQLKTPMTLLFSAFWHGVKPGYYISFFSTIAVVYAQRYFKHAFHDCLPPNKGCYNLEKLLESATSLTFVVITIISWFINTRLVDYSILPFFLLDSTKDFMTVWADIYFYGHVYIIVLFLSGFVKTQYSKLKSQ